MSTCFLIAQQFMVFMPLLCKSCGFWKMLDIFGPSWLVACEVRTVPLILVNEFMLNFALPLFGFTVIRCITVISCSRMCILGSLPLVLEALWHLDENQLCKPLGMLHILHWDVYERDHCISKCRFPSLTSNLRPDELWWKNTALRCIVYIWLDTLFWKKILQMNNILVRKFLWHRIWLACLNMDQLLVPQMIFCLTGIKLTKKIYVIQVQNCHFVLLIGDFILWL